MQNIHDKIVSIRSAVGGTYTRPDESLVKEKVLALQANQVALSYLREERGLSDEAIEHFKLGYDAAKNAISIPLYKNGQLINIKYRFLKPEEHNNVKYQLTKGCETWLFNDSGLSSGRERGKVLIVEGEIDCISAYQRGIKNVVSPGSGKDSYGVWVELLDTIPEVYIAYDNDKPGIESAKKLAERIGVEKCKEVKYPEGTKDTNEFFIKYTIDDFKKILKEATPFYLHEFVNVSSLLDAMRYKTDTVSIDIVPQVQFGRDWLAVISGITNVGKTAYCMNIADAFARKDVPTLVFPFERGIESVGKRYLQVRHNMSEADFADAPKQDWEQMKEDAVNVPVYFALPKKEYIADTIRRAKRIFNVGVVIVDHLDYLIRRSANKNEEVGRTLQELKELAIETGVIMLVVTHLNKLHSIDEPNNPARKPQLEDLKGSSNLYQDPEVVIMLYTEEPNTITVDVQKNKGRMSNKKFMFNKDTGRVSLTSETFGFSNASNQVTAEQQRLIAEEIFFND